MKRQLWVVEKSYNDSPFKPISVLAQWTKTEAKTACRRLETVSSRSYRFRVVRYIPAGDEE